MILSAKQTPIGTYVQGLLLEDLMKWKPPKKANDVVAEDGLPAGAAADRLERARGSEPVTPSASEIAPRSPAATSEGIALIEVVEETL